MAGLLQFVQLPQKCLSMLRPWPSDTRTLSGNPASVDKPAKNIILKLDFQLILLKSNIIVGFVDGVDTCSPVSWSVGAGISWVPDVGCICGGG